MDLNLNLLRVLVEILDAGSLSEAARRRRISRAQVSRELQQLELQVGSTLVRRTTRRIAATSQGRVLYEHALRILAEVESATAAMAPPGDAVHGEVRLSVPTGLADTVLDQHLLDFQARYPNIALRVLHSNRVVDLIGSAVDVAVRIASDPPRDQIAQEVRPVDWGLYAARSFLDRAPAYRVPADLTGCPFICPPTAGRHFLLRLERGSTVVDVSLRPRTESENFPYLRRAVLRGLGVGLLPSYLVAADVAAGAALRVLPDWRTDGLGNRLYLLRMPDRKPSPAVTLLLEHLHAALDPATGSEEAGK